MSDGLVTASTTRTRWSARFRAHHQLTPSLAFTHVTFYQPAVERFGAYTIETLTELEDRLWAALSFTASLHDVFDSEARLRGATSNHDGQLLFGVRTSFD
jgi:hypothetical protein